MLLFLTIRAHYLSEFQKISKEVFSSHIWVNYKNQMFCLQMLKGSLGIVLTKEIPDIMRQFSLFNVDSKGSFTDTVLNVIILPPVFFFVLLQNRDFFPLGCLSLLKWEKWWIMAHLPCYALSSSLEMMHDLNFTEGKKYMDTLFLIFLCLPLKLCYFTCCTNWPPIKKKSLVCRAHGFPLK